MEAQLDTFCKMCSYISGQYDQDESFEVLRKHLEELENGRKETNRIFYMALPPSVFIPVSQHLKKICYPKNGVARVIVRIITVPSSLNWYFVCLHCLQSRSRSRLAKISRAQESCSGHSVRTGLRRRCSASTTISAKKWSRTYSSSDSVTSSSALPGTETTSTTSRSRSKSLSAPKAAVATLTNLASYATSCRIVSSLHLSDCATC